MQNQILFWPLELSTINTTQRSEKVSDLLRGIDPEPLFLKFWLQTHFFKWTSPPYDGNWDTTSPWKTFLFPKLLQNCKEKREFKHQTGYFKEMNE